MLNRDPWALVTYTDRLPKFVGGGCTLWRFVFMRTKYRQDVGLLAHELTHIRQGWRMLLYPFRYPRLQLEVEAFRAQIAAMGQGYDPTPLVNHLRNDYLQHITEDEARQALTG